MAQLTAKQSLLVGVLAGSARRRAASGRLYFWRSA
jgi:hypothetical protein